MRARLLFATLLFPAALAAQPVLTAATHQPQAGDTPLRQALSPDTLFPGPSGSNVTWNFSALQLQPFPDSLQVLNAIPLPPQNYNVAFNATNAPSLKVDYFVSWADSLAFSGRDHNIPDFDPVQLYDSELMLRFPMAYGDQHDDHFSGTHQSIAGLTSFTGRTHVQADAFGTLVLPGGTYPDVLRIRQHDTVTVFGTDIVFDTYYFYAAAWRYPLLVIGQNTYWRGNFVETYYPQAIVTGNPAPQASQLPLLWPTPFHDALHLNTTTPGTLRILGVDGREYFNETFKMAVSEYKISLGGLPAGIYIASYRNDQGSWQQRVVRQ